MVSCRNIFENKTISNFKLHWRAKNGAKYLILFSYRKLSWGNLNRFKKNPTMLWRKISKYRRKSYRNIGKRQYRFLHIKRKIQMKNSKRRFENTRLTFIPHAERYLHIRIPSVPRLSLEIVDYNKEISKILMTRGSVYYQQASITLSASQITETTHSNDSH